MINNVYMFYGVLLNFFDVDYMGIILVLIEN